MGFYTSIPKVRAVDYLDQAGASATLGRLQRNSDVLSYYDGGIAGATAGNVWKTKAGNETVNNSVVMQSDDDLAIAVGANETWFVICSLSYTSSAVADFKYQFTGPAGATAVIASFGYSTALGNSFGGNGGLSVAFSMGGAGAIDIAVLALVKVTTAGTPGTLQLQWAQNTAEASNTTVYAGSSLVGMRMS